GSDWPRSHTQTYTRSGARGSEVIGHLDVVTSHPLGQQRELVDHTRRHAPELSRLDAEQRHAAQHGSLEHGADRRPGLAAFDPPDETRARAEPVGELSSAPPELTTSDRDLTTEGPQRGVRLRQVRPVAFHSTLPSINICLAA